MESLQSLSANARLLDVSFSPDQKPPSIPLTSDFLHASGSSSSGDFDFRGEEVCIAQTIPASVEVPKLEEYLYSGSATPCSTRSGSNSPQCDFQFDTAKRDQAKADRALLRAVRSGNSSDCVQLLQGTFPGCATANAHLRTTGEDTLLHVVCKTGDSRLCQELISQGLRQSLNCKNEAGQTPLHVACHMGHLDVVKELIKAGAVLGEIDVEGNTPMHCAAIARHFDISKFLRISGADATIRNSHGRTATEYQTMKTLSDLRKTMQSSSWRSPPIDRHKRSPSRQIYPKPSDFELISMLGKGSFGEVFLVKEHTSGKQYAMKVMKKEKIHSMKMIKYAFTERNILCTVRNPFIVGVHSAFQTAEDLFLVIDYCPGGDLAKYLARERKITEERARIYVSEMLLAIEELHRHDVLYRDLKPENIVLSEDGHAVLTDFGLSKEGVPDNYAAKSFCGSLGYLAPEMLKKQGHGKAADWYMLGVLLYELITGTLPYYSRDRETLFRNIERGKLTFPGGVSAAAKDLLERLLCRDPEARLGSGEAGADEIKSHCFFAGVDWTVVARKGLKAPPPQHSALFTKPIPPDCSPLTCASDNPHTRIPGWEFQRSGK